MSLEATIRKIKAAKDAMYIASEYILNLKEISGEEHDQLMDELQGFPDLGLDLGDLTIIEEEEEEEEEETKDES